MTEEKWVIQEIATAEYPTKVKSIEFFDSKEEAKERYDELKVGQKFAGKARRYQTFTYPEKISKEDLKRLQKKNVTSNVKQKINTKLQEVL